jgi:hypothetical protein
MLGRDAIPGQQAESVDPAVAKGFCDGERPPWVTSSLRSATMSAVRPRADSSPRLPDWCKAGANRSVPRVRPSSLSPPKLSKPSHFQCLLILAADLEPYDALWIWLDRRRRRRPAHRQHFLVESKAKLLTIRLVRFGRSVKGRSSGSCAFEVNAGTSSGSRCD